jgi:uncharacterized YigZ family protein
MDDFYYTIGKAATLETKVRGSRFIAQVEWVETTERALEVLRAIQKKEHAATHNCYSYRTGFGSKQEIKYSDDGEPSGTAGKPIFDCIAGRQLTNVIVVVTRYFGGTKLGTGGLARAYSEAAVKALNEAGTKTIYLTDSITVSFNITYYDRIHKLVQSFEAKVNESEFNEAVKLKLSVRKSRTNDLKSRIINLSHGRAKFE